MTKCEWCGKEKKAMSEWESEHLYKGWLPLCKPCATKRLNNPYNALLSMRRITESKATTCCCMLCPCNKETDLVNSDNNICDLCTKGNHAPRKDTP